MHSVIWRKGLHIYNTKNCSCNKKKFYELSQCFVFFTHVFLSWSLLSVFFCLLLFNFSNFVCEKYYPSRSLNNLCRFYLKEFSFVNTIKMFFFTRKQAPYFFSWDNCFDHWATGDLNSRLNFLLGILRIMQ